MKSIFIIILLFLANSVFCHAKISDCKVNFFLTDDNIVLQKDGNIMISIVSNKQQDIHVSLYKT